MALVQAELKKIWTGKMWWVLLVIAVPWCAYIAYSFGVLETQEAGPVDPAALTRTVAQQWFQMHLFTSVLGVMAVTREYSSSTVARSVLLGGGRTRLFWSKTAAATIVAVLYGLLAVVLAVASAWVTLPLLDVEPVWSGELTLTLVGVLAASVLAAPWGAFLGWIFRNQVVAILVLLLLTLMVEPLLLQVNSEAFNWTFSVALQAIYRDPHEGLLAVPVAYAVAGAWIVLSGIVGYSILRSRDVR
ncbi:ABC transporter permease [Georgenia sunbinii]|uniref:ABC transporter permease n=1 Tax=Georgenia sunbinii TaxID=3117728 RepID=UPI002F266CC5